MPPDLVSQIIAPTHTYVLRLAAMGLGCGLIGASMMFAAQPPRIVQAPPITLAEAVATPNSIPGDTLVATEAMPDLSPSSVSIVFQAGGATYIKLANAGPSQRHGKVKLSETDDVHEAVATIAEADVPAGHRSWIGKEVVVDGSCHATVTGFAFVARLTGDPAYSNGMTSTAWTAKAVVSDGSPMLAARLDGCKGGVLARDASMSKMVIPTVIHDDRLVERATRRLLASAEAKAARREWSAYQAEDGISPSALDLGELSSIVVRHPTTGITYVSIHGTTGGACGIPDIGVWGLYRVDPDGTLTRIPSAVGQLLSIEELVDIDGDGQLEVVGQPWLGTEHMVNRLTGETIEQLDLPFFGCPC